MDILCFAPYFWKHYFTTKWSLVQSPVKTDAPVFSHCPKTCWSALFSTLNWSSVWMVVYKGTPKRLTKFYLSICDANCQMCHWIGHSNCMSSTTCRKGERASCGVLLLLFHLIFLSRRSKSVFTMRSVARGDFRAVVHTFVVNWWKFTGGTCLLWESAELSLLNVQ